jgi:hypothetical protein
MLTAGALGEAICESSMKKQLPKGHEHSFAQAIVDGSAGWGVGTKKEGC